MASPKMASLSVGHIKSKESSQTLNVKNQYPPTIYPSHLKPMKIQLMSPPGRGESFSILSPQLCLAFLDTLLVVLSGLHNVI